MQVQRDAAEWSWGMRGTTAAEVRHVRHLAPPCPTNAEPRSHETGAMRWLATTAVATQTLICPGGGGSYVLRRHTRRHASKRPVVASQHPNAVYLETRQLAGNACTNMRLKIYHSIEFLGTLKFGQFEPS